MSCAMVGRNRRSGIVGSNYSCFFRIFIHVHNYFNLLDAYKSSHSFVELDNMTSWL